MLHKSGKAILFVFIYLLAVPARAQVASDSFTVHIPTVDTGSKGVYIAGSFNYWHAGDSLYRMQKVNEGIYSITLPLFENMQYKYKYTSGNWDRVEIAVNDSNISNRQFEAVNGKSITDTVVKWKIPPQALNNTNPQLAAINAKKDSLLAKLQPKLDVMLGQLKLYIENLLQKKPKRKVHRKLDKETISIIGGAFTEVTGLLWDVVGALQPAQKKKIMALISQPEAKKDFLNSFSKALETVLQEKKMP